MDGYAGFDVQGLESSLGLMVWRYNSGFAAMLAWRVSLESLVVFLDILSYRKHPL